MEKKAWYIITVVCCVLWIIIQYKLLKKNLILRRRAQLGFNQSTSWKPSKKLNLYMWRLSSKKFHGSRVMSWQDDGFGRGAILSLAVVVLRQLAHDHVRTTTIRNNTQKRNWLWIQRQRTGGECCGWEMEAIGFRVLGRLGIFVFIPPIHNKLASDLSFWSS